MYALSIATLVLAAVSVPSAAYIVPREAAPSSYATGYLESYDIYHRRYMNLGCNTKHHTAFFNACCHPMLANETLETARPSYCNPSNSASASTSAAQAIGTAADDDCDEYEDSEDESASVTATSSSLFTPQSTIDPTPTSTTTSSTKQAAPTTSLGVQIDASDVSAEVFTGGQATYFYQNGVAGACGTVHSDSDWIVALDQIRYGNSGDPSQYCGKTVSITGNGVTREAVVADDCPTCNNENCLDMSAGLFEQFAPLSKGIFPITWYFVN